VVEASCATGKEWQMKKMGDAIPGQKIARIGNRALAQGSRMQRTKSLSAAPLSARSLEAAEAIGAAAEATWEVASGGGGAAPRFLEGAVEVGLQARGELLLGTEGGNLGHVLGVASQPYVGVCERAMMPGSTRETRERGVVRGAFGEWMVDRRRPCRRRLGRLAPEGRMGHR
jgi:hypothetical protein